MTRGEAARCSGLVRRIGACRICRDEPAGAPLPHEPRPVLRIAPNASIAVCGQAPGLRVHESGVPFSDRSGDRLRAWMGLTPHEFYDRERVAIIPMGFCFPGYDTKGSDLPPRTECAPAWRAEVFAVLPRLRLLLAVGRYAISWHLPERARAPLGETLADWRAILEARRAGPAVLVVPHPSWRNTGWLMEHSWFEAEVVPELQRQVRLALLKGA